MNSLAARVAPVGLWILVSSNSSCCRRLGSIFAQACSYHFFCSAENGTGVVAGSMAFLVSLVARRELFTVDVGWIGTQLDQTLGGGVDHDLRSAEISDRVGRHIAFAQGADRIAMVHPFLRI